MNPLDRSGALEELKERMDKMQQDFKSYDEYVKEQFKEASAYTRQQQKAFKTLLENNLEGVQVLHNILDTELPGWREKHHIRGYGYPLTKAARKKVDEFREILLTMHANDKNDDDK